MPRKLIPLFAALVLIVVTLGVWIGVLLSRSQGNKDEQSPYSVVYLQTGDIYYGKLRHWPRLHLVDPWYLLRDLQSGETNIVPFVSTFSGPDKELYLNPEQVVWWAALRKDSQVAKGLAGAGQIQVPAPTGTPSSTQ